MSHNFSSDFDINVPSLVPTILPRIYPSVTWNNDLLSLIYLHTPYCLLLNEQNSNTKQIQCSSQTYPSQNHQTSHGMQKVSHLARNLISTVPVEALGSWYCPMVTVPCSSYCVYSSFRGLGKYTRARQTGFLDSTQNKSEVKKSVWLTVVSLPNPLNDGALTSFSRGRG